MTREEFETIFDKLYYACIQPTEKADKIYSARMDSYWDHFQHVRREFFEGAVLSYLIDATEGPFFPALGELRAIKAPEEIAIIKVLPTESLDLRELAILRAFQANKGDKKLYSYALGGGRFSLKKEKIEVFPWESVG